MAALAGPLFRGCGRRAGGLIVIAWRRLGGIHGLDGGPVAALCELCADIAREIVLALHSDLTHIPRTKHPRGKGNNRGQKTTHYPANRESERIVT